MKTLPEQLAAARRELALRQRVYPGWVAQRKLSGPKATHETECMAAIVATLEKLQLLAEVSEEIKNENGTETDGGAGSRGDVEPQFERVPDCKPSATDDPARTQPSLAPMGKQQSLFAC
jgi:hypothetical protein